MNKILRDINQVIKNATNIVIIQADNPDGDSLASALAFEQIIGDMGKTPHMYCGVNIPDYLKFMPGWDRVSQDLPANVDASIIVDTSSNILLDKLNHHSGKPWVAAHPVIIIDHHQNVECDIPYATLVHNPDGYAATGEVIYEMALQLGWELSISAMNMLAQSILSDSLGLTTESTTAATYRRIADMIDAGVDRIALEDARKELSKMPYAVFRYKAKLIERTEFFYDGQLAVIIVPEEELFTVGTLYNPKVLILNEIVQVDGVRIAIMLKRYKHKVTGAIRCVDKSLSAKDLAERFGGGGHQYVAGFKLENPRQSFADIKQDVVSAAFKLLQ